MRYLQKIDSGEQDTAGCITFAVSRPSDTMSETLLLNQVLGKIVSISPNIVPLATKELPTTTEQVTEWQETEDSEEVEFAFEQTRKLLNDKIATGVAIPTLLSVKEGDTLKQDTITKLRRELSDAYWLYKAYANVICMTIQSWDDKDPIDPECLAIGEEAPKLCVLLEDSGSVFDVDKPVPDWLLEAQRLVNVLNANITSHDSKVRSVDVAQDELFEQMDKALSLLNEVLQRQVAQDAGAPN